MATFLGGRDEDIDGARIMNLRDFTTYLASLVGALVLILWGPVAAAEDYALTVSRDTQDHYVGQIGYQGVIETQFCYQFVYFDNATLRLTTASTGTLIFSSGQQCPVVNVFDPATVAANTYSAFVNSNGDGYYELTDGSALIKAFGIDIAIGASATIVITSAINGAAFGTITVANSYPQALSRIYVSRQSSSPAPTLPNLVVTSFAATPISVNAGAVATLTAIVKNVGSASSGATMLRYYQWNGTSWGELTFCADSVEALIPNASSSQSCSISMPSSPGDYLFLAGIDQVPGEISTSDNISNQVKVTVTASPTTYVLTVSKAGTGAGWVATTPSGINCAVGCSASFAAGTTVTIWAAPTATDSSFAGWSGAGCSGMGPCVVTMTESQSVTATFNTIGGGSSYPLTVTTTGSGAGWVATTPPGINCASGCSATFGAGTNVTIWAAPTAAGSVFAGWSGEGCSGTGPCIVTMSAARNVTATFNTATSAYPLTVTTAGTGAGWVASTPAGIDCAAGCAATFNAGTTVTIWAAPTSAGSTFAGWSGEGCAGVGACTVLMTAARNVTANFTTASGSYPLTVTRAGTGSGRVASTPAGINCGSNCAATFGSATTVTLWGAPTDAGSNFAGWSGEGCAGTGPCTVSMAAARHVTATFTLIAPVQTSSYVVGSNPYGIAFDGANMWVALNSSGSVAKLRTSDGAVLGTFATGTNPVGVAFDGGYVWVANAGSNNVTKLRVSDGAKVGTFPVASPIGVSFDGANMWVANYNSNSVTKLRASDGANLGTFPVGQGPSFVTFDGANVWVGNSVSNSVTKLRTTDGADLGTFSVGAGPQGMAFDGVNLWVANVGDNSVTQLRSSDGAILGTYPAGANPAGVAYDGANVWIANYGSNSVTELRTSDGSFVGSFNVGVNPYGVVYDGARVWVTNHGANTVSKLSP